MMQTAVEQLRQGLAVDRVLAYRLFPDGSDSCLVEAVFAPCPSGEDQSRIQTAAMQQRQLFASRFAYGDVTSDVSKRALPP